MKRVLPLLLAVIILFSFTTSCFADETYYLSYPGITVSLSDLLDKDCYVLTRETSRSSPLWNQLGLDYDSASSYFESNHIYLDAIASNGDFEIIITAVESAFSKKINNLGDYSDKELEELCETVVNGLNSSGISVSEHKIVASSGSVKIKYFVFEISQIIDGQTISGRMFSTVFNGKTINYTIHLYNGSSMKMNLDSVIWHLKYDKVTSDDTSTSPVTQQPSVSSNRISGTGYRVLVAVVSSLFVGLLAVLIRFFSKKGSHRPQGAQSDSQESRPSPAQVIGQNISAPVAQESSPLAVKSAIVEQATSAQKATSFSISLDHLPPKLHRAFLFLEDEEWDRANQYLESVLDEDPTNAYAYLGKAMAGLKISTPAEIPLHTKELNENKDFKKALRFASKELSAKFGTLF